MSFSGKAIHRASLSAGQEAFFEGHLHALRNLGGVPTGRVRYDNLKSAVAQVLGFTRARVETEHWTAFRSHLGLEAFYCQPGIEGAHEKGGVEGQIGWFRRDRLVPVTEVDSIAELNALIDGWDAADDARSIGTRPRTIGEHYALERPCSGRCRSNRSLVHSTSRPLLPGRHPHQPHQPLQRAGPTHRPRTPRPTPRLGIGGLRRSHGSRPTRAAPRKRRQPSRTRPLVGGTAPQTRCATRSHRARPSPRRRQIHPRPRRLVGRRPQTHGDQDGTRALIEVLLLHRHLPHEQLVAGLAAALQAGALTADAVALEARKIADTHTAPDTTNLDSPDPVASFTQRRLAQLPPDHRPLPSVAAYDQLLRHTNLQEGTPS